MKSFKFFSILVLATASLNCVTIFSEFQSAETLGEGNTEITPAASYVGFYDDGDQEHIQTNIGVLAGYGINETLDLRGRVELPMIADEFETFGDVIAIGFGPKIKIGDNNASFYSPIGFAFGDDIETSETYEWHPTLIMSTSLKDGAELNGSFKLIIPFEEERDNALALNLGLAKWASNTGIRPEIGIMKNLNDETGIFFHAGVAVSFRNK